MTRASRVVTLIAAILAATVPALDSRQQAGGVSQLAWFDRTGTRQSTLGGVGDIGNIELSPDGRRVAVAVLDPTRGTRDLWFYDADTGERTRFTSAPADENWLVWSPDGRRVAYNAFSPRSLDLLVGPSSDSGESDVVYTDGNGKWPVSWSPDGRTLLVVTNAAETGNDIWVLPLTGSREAVPLLRTRAAENWAAFSPDGRWIAYSASDTGVAEVYVMRYPATGQRWRISSGGGSAARWRRDGREIYYVAPDRWLMAAAVDGTSDEFVMREPVELFETRFPYPPYHSFDVSPDGRRFLVNAEVVSPTAPGRIAQR